MLVGASAAVHLLRLGREEEGGTPLLTASVSATLSQRLTATALDCGSEDPLVASSSFMVVFSCAPASSPSHLAHVFTLSDAVPHASVTLGGGAGSRIRSLALAAEDLFMRVAHTTSVSLQRVSLSLLSAAPETVATWEGGSDTCISCVSASEGVLATLGDCSAGGAVELWTVPSNGTWSRTAIVGAAGLSVQLPAGETTYCVPSTICRAPSTCNLPLATFHFSPLLNRNLTLTASYVSPLASRNSPLATRHSPLTYHQSPLATHHSRITNQHSLTHH